MQQYSEFIIMSAVSVPTANICTDRSQGLLSEVLQFVV